SDQAALPIPALAVLLSAAFDRAALAIDAGAEPADFKAAMIGIIERILGPAGQGGSESMVTSG
ncbi:hypothetical protein, partial [Escherichia coli]|uniref:hypothetical protein n=1 Tax=Escherichia coli TaxID=562 RepID=UPI001954EC08